MKTAVIACGDRHATPTQWACVVSDALSPLLEASALIVIHGGARGIDAIAASWARSHEVTAEAYLADWDAYGRRAGPLRNQAMCRRLLELFAEGYVVHVYAFHDAIAGSKGTRHLARTAYNARLAVTVIKSDGSRMVYERGET